VRHLDLFSGIGGFAIAARNVGWETVGFCEIDPYCQKVLRKHWPGVPIYEDVRNVTAERLRADGIIWAGAREASTVDDTESFRCRYGNDRTNKRQTTGEINPLASTSHSSKSRIDILTGGFPCQDISVAGKQAGIDGERSGLWSELARIIGEVRPRYAVLENVAALLSGDSGRWFQRVLGDLAEIGYDCEWHCIPASAVGAPHRRDRVWIIAYPGGTGSRDDKARGRRGRAQAESEAVQQENGETHASDAGPICESVAYPKSEPSNGGDDNARVSTQQQTIPQSGNGGGTDAMADALRPRRSIGLSGQDAGQEGEPRIADYLGNEIGRARAEAGMDLWATEPNVGQLVDGLPARLAGLRGLTDDQRWIQIPCAETAEGCLRDLRKHKNALRSPHRQGLEEQRPIEFDDAVQFLSHIIASCSGRDSDQERETALQALQENILSSGNVQHAPDEVQAVWQSIDDTAADWFILATCLGRNWVDSPIGRVASGVPKRVDRLKGLGNAIVPQVAEVIFRAIEGKK